MISVWATAAHGFPGFLSDWRNTYPGSSSDNINCQLCHQSIEGDQPWNSYGFAIRFEYLINGNDQIAAFNTVESLNSDGDSAGRTNIEEINAGDQPGWESGPVNNIYFVSNGNVTVVPNQQPPAAIDPIPDPIQNQRYPIELVDAGTGFTAPVGGAAAPVAELADQLFIIDQTGVIWRLHLDNGDKEVFIDVSARLVDLGFFGPGSYDERGLLGFAFHPDYANNGLLYLYTSEPVSGAADFTTLAANEAADHQSVITELIIGNPLQTTGLAIISGEREILRLDQPQFNHNGGDLLFDQNSMLLIAIGDGGSADDQGLGHGVSGNGSDPSNPFGTILRINPLGGTMSNPKYGIPGDNPFVGDAQILDEIYAYGFRNPWRMSFDGADLYVADVGQNHVEEIDIVESGEHYGWNYKEGSFYFLHNDALPGYVSVEPPQGLPPIDFKDPVFEYDHGEGISVIGGRVYRGRKLPGLAGKYVFADFLKRLFVGDTGTGAIESIDLDVDFFVYSFATDSAGELYAMGVRTDAPFPGTSGTDGVVVKLSATEFCFPVKKPSSKRVIFICM